MTRAASVTWSPPATGPTRSSVPSQGMFGWFQLIQASRVPSGDGVGKAKNCAPETSTRIASASSAADAVQRHRDDLPAHRHAAADVEAVRCRAVRRQRQHRLPDAPDLVPAGGQHQVGEAEAGPSGVSGTGSMPASTAPPAAYSRWSAKLAKTRSKPPDSDSDGTGR